MPPSYELQSLERALGILRHLSTAGQANLVDIASELEINQTTCLRAVRVLERYGYVRRTPDGRGYALGMRLVELGALALNSIDVIAILRPYITGLVREHRVTAHVGILREGMVTVVDKIDPLDTVVRYSLVGTRMPLHCTAMGKALLALYGVDRLPEAGLAPPLVSYTNATICDLRTLGADVSRTITRGHSLELEEWQPGFACVGSAFRFGDQEIAVSLSGVIVPNEALNARGENLSATIREFIQAHGGTIAVAL